MARKIRVVYLLIMIAFLCLCACDNNYFDYNLGYESLCSFLNKKLVVHNLYNGSAARITPQDAFDFPWNEKFSNKDFRCTFVFKTSKGEGLFAVIHKMSFRRNHKCIDYVRFKRSDGYSTDKFCGDVNLGQPPITESYLDPPENANRPRDYNIVAEYDPIKNSHQETSTIETEIFISMDTPGRDNIDLTLVYTPFKNCAQTDPKKYSQVGYDICIRKDYMCDKIFNCHPSICSDEDRSKCVHDRYPKDDTATKVTVGAVTTMILCFIIFVMCLWICKKSQKLCWSSDCAGPNVCSRPTSFPGEDGGQGSNRGVPTAPMLEVAVSSPVVDKDLPPSYDSLFPEQSNPARS